MSYLREIMQRLNSRSSSSAAEPSLPADRVLLGVHLEQYRQRLEECDPAMLQYEWVWLEQHIEALEFCGSQPGMVAAAGGIARVQALLAESHRFRELLVQRMAAAGLTPSLHRATVVPTEHAWELSQSAIRRQWGIDPAAPEGPPPSG
jgi:hypothetical protein